MPELPKPRVGVIATMSPDPDWPSPFPERTERFGHQTVQMLQEIGMDAVFCGKAVRGFRDMAEEGKRLRAEGIHALVLTVGTWTYSNASAVAAQEAGVPTVVFAPSELGAVSIVGASISRGALDQLGIPAWLTYGDFAEPRVRREMGVRLRGAAAASMLRGTVYGVAGGRCMGMLTGEFDPHEWRTRFGVEIDSWEQIDIIERSKKIPDQEAQAFLDWMRAEYSEVNAKEEVMLAQIKMYLALKAFVKEKRYDFISVKSLPELPYVYTTFCLAEALFNDQSDASGPKESIVCNDESDGHGALTMQILKNLSGGPTMATDVLHIDYDDNLLRLCNFSQPTDFAPSHKHVIWEPEGLGEFKWLMGGCTPQYVARAGELTLARISKIAGEYAMLILLGDSVEFPREKTREINYRQPHVFVHPRCPMDDFIRELRCNHIHLTFGDFREELVEACRVLGIRPIVLRNE